MARRKTVHNQSARAYSNIDPAKLFDDNCTICMENFVQNQKIMVAPCNHSFHQDCILNWIKSQSIKVIKDR